MANAPKKTETAAVALTGLAAAVADGWKPHPDTAGYHYKGTDVKKDAEVAALYPAESPSGASGGNGGGDNAALAAESSAADQNTPEQAAASAPEDETPSEVSDQVSPAAENPSEAVAAETAAIVEGKARTPAAVKEALAGAPEGETPAEVVDQVTPIGTDLALAKFLGSKDSKDPAEVQAAARELFSTLSDEDRDGIEQHMNAEMLKIVEKVAKGNKARREAANMIDGNLHYGTRVRG